MLEVGLEGWRQYCLWRHLKAWKKSPVVARKRHASKIFWACISRFASQVQVCFSPKKNNVNLSAWKLQNVEESFQHINLEEHVTLTHFFRAVTVPSRCKTRSDSKAVSSPCSLDISLLQDYKEMKATIPCIPSCVAFILVNPTKHVTKCQKTSEDKQEFELSRLRLDQTCCAFNLCFASPCSSSLHFPSDLSYHFLSWKTFHGHLSHSNSEISQDFCSCYSSISLEGFFRFYRDFCWQTFFSVVGSATGSLSWAARGVSFPFAAIPAPTERLLLLPAPAKSFQKNHWPLEALPSGSVQAISLWIKNQVQYIIQPTLATIPIQYSLQMRTQKAMSMLRHSWSVQDAWCWAMPGSASSWASPVNASPQIHAKAQKPCTNVRVRDGFKFKCVVSATWWLRPPEPGFSDPWP